MTYQCSEEQALKDFSGHEMRVIRDDGTYRHIRFKRPRDTAYWFDLITWPGALCIDGDMGTYVFKRLEDMFEFFRTDRREGKLNINPQYWAEKLSANSRFGNGFKEFSEQRFRDAVKEEFDAWVESEEPSDEVKAELWEDLTAEVLFYSDGGHTLAIDAAMEFRSSNRDVKFDMRDFYERRLEDYTFHFIWCCYAIAWGIEKYDSFKSEGAERCCCMTAWEKHRHEQEPAMKQMQNCCDEVCASHGCNQGRNCPVRIERIERIRKLGKEHSNRNRIAEVVAPPLISIIILLAFWVGSTYFQTALT